MQPIQDKDLDNLFKQRFEDLEVQPSAGSWKKITDTLDKPHKRSKLNPIWMAAASVVLLATATLLLYKPVEVIKLQGRADTELAAKVEKKSGTELPEREVIQTEIAQSPMLAAQPLNVKANRPLATAKKTDVQQSIKSQVHQKVYPEVINAKDASLATLKDKLPVENAEVKPKTNVYEPVYTARVEINEEIGSETEPSKPRIKTVGGLVNFVIAQVDKREDKIIEFKEGEEGSEVSGINIGLLKLKSRKR